MKIGGYYLDVNRKIKQICQLDALLPGSIRSIPTTR